MYNAPIYNLKYNTYAHNYDWMVELNCVIDLIVIEIKLIL